MIASEGGIRGRVLDVGCGTGESVVFFASLGLQASGMNIAPRAIEKARRKASQRGLSAKFIVDDALHLE